MKRNALAALVPALFVLVLLFVWVGTSHCQTTSLMPSPCPQFFDKAGHPLAGGKVFTYSAGTTTNQATYVDASGLVPNTNPIILNSGGFAQVPSGSTCGIWLGQQTYKIRLTTSTGVEVWTVDNVSDPGFFYTTQAVLLNPAGGVLQTVVGPLAANYFQGNTPHTTSPGVRVSILDPATTLDTASNPPVLMITAPAQAGQQYQVPNPGTYQSNYVMNPSPPDWTGNFAYSLNILITPYTNNPCYFTFKVTIAGTSQASNPVFSTTPCASSAATVNDGTLVWTSQGNVTPTNQLDCTLTGITCKRTAYFYMEGGGCNNTTAGLGWDTFATNSPTPLCLTGSNIQKGVMGLPSAATPVQTASCTGAAAATCVLAYPTATTAGNLLVISCAVDGGKTITGITDGTNAYTKAVAVANGNTDVEIWYFNGSAAAKAAATNLTTTLSAGANSACRWREYQDILTAAQLDKTASSTGTSVTPSSGTTAGTAQNVELVLVAVASPSNPTVTGAAGFTEHGAVSQSTNVTVDSEAKIQQATATQNGTFTLGSSQAWASAIATFKANVGLLTQAQRQFALPAFFNSNVNVNATLKWQNPVVANGTIQSVLGAAIICTADGSTDDPAFNTAGTATVTVSASGANILTSTPLNALSSTGCGAGNLLHFQVQRLRYNASDTYENYLYLTGASLQFGITQ